MRICMPAYTFYENDNRVKRYAESLATRGDHVDVLALRKPQQQRYECVNGVHLYRIQNRSYKERQPVSYLWRLLVFFLLSTWKISIRSLRQPYDVVHVHSVPDFEVFAALFAKLRGSRVILDIHDIVPEFYASKFNCSRQSLIFRVLVGVEKLSCAFADAVIISNHLWEQTLEQRSVPANKLLTLMNYPDGRIFCQRQRNTRSDNPFVLLYPGSLNWHQGVDVAIRAVAKLAATHPQLQLHIYGEGGQQQQLQQLTLDLHVADKVQFIGAVPMEKIVAAIAEATLGVVPKRAEDQFGNEAFSTKVLEFMAMGTPVLLSATRIDRFYFSDQLVCFFASGDVDDLAAKIDMLVRQPQRRRQLADNASAYVADKMWEARQQEYFSLVDSFTNKRCRTATSANSKPAAVENS